MGFPFIDPSGSGVAITSEPATRLETLEGAHLGLLDNGKTNADKFLTMVGEILTERYGVAEVTMYRKDALSKPAPIEVIEALAEEADFGVTGIGDCGSCSTNSIHDGIEIEKRGTACVAVATEAFVPGLAALTKMRGMPDYQFAVVPHPLGVLFDDELRERAELAATQVAELAVGSAEGRSVAPAGSAQ